MFILMTGEGGYQICLTKDKQRKLWELGNFGRGQGPPSGETSITNNPHPMPDAA